MAHQRRLFGLALLMLAVEAGAAVFEAYPLAYLIDFLRGDRPTITWFGTTRNHTILALTVAIVAIAAVNSLCDSMAEIFLAKAGRLLGFNVRTALFDRLQRLSLAFHDHRRTGDVLARVTGDVDTLEDFIIKSSSDIAGSVLLLAFTLAFLGVRSWSMLLAAATIVPLVSAVSHYFSTRIRATSKSLRAVDGEVASSTQEMLSSIRVIQTYGRAGYEQHRFEEHNNARVVFAMGAAVLQAKFSFVVKVLESLVVCAVVWLGLVLIDRGTITVGLLVMFVLLIQNMFKPTRRIIQEWGTIGKVLASSDRIGELLDREPAVVDHPGAIVAPVITGDVRFDHVTFSYSTPETASGAAAQQPVRATLRDVSFHVPAGRVLALIGHTGAGKSTVLQLLPRLYDVDSGQVLIDDHDVRDLTIDSLRGAFSVVLQDTILFSGTVAENIAYGRMDATLAEIAAAARLASAHEFIEQLPNGYGTVLGERGANLSGGQRQRIAIARAYIRRAPILLLDEPTTGLDVESATVVLDALRTLMRNKTTIIVSHDLKLIRYADEILLIDQGQVQEQGTHEALLASGGLYARLQATNAGHPLADDESDELDVTAWAADSSLQLDRWLPTLAVAFDGAAMGHRIAASMLDPGYQVDSCQPGKAAYLADGSCTFRYELELRGPGKTTDQHTTLVLAHVFGHAAQAAEEHQRADALRASATGHRLLAPFRAPVAVFEDLSMLLTAFPLDVELPALVATTDAEVMRDVLAATLFRVTKVEVHPSHYRQHRCVVRYRVHGYTTLRVPTRLVLYGKVAYDDRADRAIEVLETLHEHRGAPGGGDDVRLPRVVLHRPDLGLLVLDEVAGSASLASVIAAELRGGTLDDDDHQLSALVGVAQAARVAAFLHDTPAAVADVRHIDDDLTKLIGLLGVLEPLSQPLASWLVNALHVAARALATTEPSPLTLAHGDFTHTQLLFEGTSPALIDFDTVCRAEPALDLGQFTAYLRLVAAKAVGTPDERADALCRHFIDTYLDRRATSLFSDLMAIRRRVAAYELISLVRIAAHSWHKVKAARLALAVALVRASTQRVTGRDPGLPATDREKI